MITVVLFVGPIGTRVLQRTPSFTLSQNAFVRIGACKLLKHLPFLLKSTKTDKSNFKRWSRNSFRPSSKNRCYRGYSKVFLRNRSVLPNRCCNLPLGWRSFTKTSVPTPIGFGLSLLLTEHCLLLQLPHALSFTKVFQIRPLQVKLGMERRNTVPYLPSHPQQLGRREEHIKCVHL